MINAANNDYIIQELSNLFGTKGRYYYRTLYFLEKNKDRLAIYQKAEELGYVRIEILSRCVSNNIEPVATIFLKDLGAMMLKYENITR